MDERIATEVGAFSDRGGADAAVARLERQAIPGEDIGVVADPRKAREIVGKRAGQLVVPMSLVGAVAGKLPPRRDPDHCTERVERGNGLVTVKVTRDERSRVRRIRAAAGAVNRREEPTGEAP